MYFYLYGSFSFMYRLHTRGQRRVSELLEVELQALVGGHVDAGNQPGPRESREPSLQAQNK